MGRKVGSREEGTSRRHRVVIAVNGREALNALEKQTFDVVLMDGEMPEMDGFEATGMVRDQEKTTGTRVPIIALTAHAMQGDKDRCLAAGMDGYVSKPHQVGRTFFYHWRCASAPPSQIGD